MEQYELQQEMARANINMPNFELSALILRRPGKPQLDGYTPLKSGSVEDLADFFMSLGPHTSIPKSAVLAHLKSEAAVILTEEAMTAAVTSAPSSGEPKLKLKPTAFAAGIMKGEYKPGKKALEARPKPKERVKKVYAEKPWETEQAIRATTALFVGGAALLILGLGGGFTFVMPMSDNHKAIGVVMIVITAVVMTLSWLWYVGYFRGTKAVAEVEEKKDKDGNVLVQRVAAVVAQDSKFKTHAVLVWGVLSAIYGWAKAKADAWSERLEADAKADRAQREREAKAKKRKEKKAEKAALLANPATPPP